VVEHLLDLGRPVYLVDYGDVSTLRDADLGLEHWIDEVLPFAVRTASQDAGDRPVQLLGWCLGGILAMYSQAARTDLPIASIATVASPFDFREVRLLEPIRMMEELTDGKVTTTLVRVLGGVPGKANSLIFKWLSPDKQLKKPLTVLKNRSNPEVLAQIEAVDVMMDSMEAYPGRSIAQIYHTFVRTNHLSEGHVKLRDDRVVDLANVTVPVLNIAGKGDLFFAPPASAYRLGELLPNSPHVRLETAPGGHLGVLTGSRARTTTWKYLAEFLSGVDADVAGGEDSDVEEAAG
jgi:polyhydroxyalkanoate synthase